MMRPDLTCTFPSATQLAALGTEASELQNIEHGMSNYQVEESRIPVPCDRSMCRSRGVLSSFCGC